MTCDQLLTFLLSISTRKSVIDNRLTKIIRQKNGQLSLHLPLIQRIPSNLKKSFQLNIKLFQLGISVKSVAPTENNEGDVSCMGL